MVPIWVNKLDGIYIDQCNLQYVFKNWWEKYHWVGERYFLILFQKKKAIIRKKIGGIISTKKNFFRNTAQHMIQPNSRNKFHEKNWFVHGSIIFLPSIIMTQMALLSPCDAMQVSNWIRDHKVPMLIAYYLMNSTTSFVFFFVVGVTLDQLGYEFFLIERANITYLIPFIYYISNDINYNYIYVL